MHYLARHGESRVSKAAIISATAPYGANGGQSEGLPKKVFDDLQAQIRPTVPNSIAYFFGSLHNDNKTGKPAEATIQNWWRQGTMGGAKAADDGSSRSRRPTSPRI